MFPILRLDAAGSPIEWLGYEHAARYVTNEKVQWSTGQVAVTLLGGTNHQGVQSRLELPSIIATKGKMSTGQGVPMLTKRGLLKRDRCICAYCGGVFKECDLQMERIIPRSKSGPTSWQNLVSACGSCNSFKADRTPEQAKMKLLYVPYVPNMHEGLILEGRRVLADQMEFLRQGLPRHSRLLLS